MKQLKHLATCLVNLRDSATYNVQWCDVMVMKLLHPGRMPPSENNLNQGMVAPLLHPPSSPPCEEMLPFLCEPFNAVFTSPELIENSTAYSLFSDNAETFKLKISFIFCDPETMVQPFVGSMMPLLIT